MMNSQNLSWIQTSTQKSLNLSLFEFKSYSEDVDKAIEKFMDIIEDDDDYEKIMKFHLALVNEVENSRKAVKEMLRKSVKNLRKIFLDIFGFDKEFEVEVSTLEEYRKSAKKSLVMLQEDRSQKNSEILNHTLDLSQSTICFSKDSNPYFKVNGQDQQNFMKHKSKFTSSFFIKSPENCNPLNIDSPLTTNKSIQTSKQTYFPKKTVSVQTDDGSLNKASVSTQNTELLSSTALSEPWVYVTCDACGINPIVGVRYKCAQCDNFDLCRGCYLNTDHASRHNMTMMVKR